MSVNDLSCIQWRTSQGRLQPAIHLCYWAVPARRAGMALVIFNYQGGCMSHWPFGNECSFVEFGHWTIMWLCSVVDSYDSCNIWRQLCAVMTMFVMICRHRWRQQQWLPIAGPVLYRHHLSLPFHAHTQL